MRKSLLIVGLLSISFAIAAETPAINGILDKTIPSTEDQNPKRTRDAEMPDPHEKLHRREVSTSSTDTDSLSSSLSSFSGDDTTSSSTSSTSESESEVEDEKTEGAKPVTAEKKEYTPEEISALKKAVTIADLRIREKCLRTDAMLTLRQAEVFEGMADAEETPEETNTIKIATLIIDIRFMRKAILHAEEAITEISKLIATLTKLKDASTTSEERQKAQEMCQSVIQSQQENQHKLQRLKQELAIKIVMLRIQGQEATPAT